jgi:hypothetical protein
MDPNQDGSARRLFFCGFLILFLELVLIRYLAGTIWNLGYFPNFVLLAVFVGMGIGFLLPHPLSRRTALLLFQAGPFVLLLLVLLVKLVGPSVPGFGQLSGTVGGEVFFTATPDTSGARSSYGLFALWFVTVVVVFALLAQWTARLFRLFSPLKAYTLDISGSCAGIVAFMAVSWLQLPAYSWFLIVLALVIASLDTAWKWRWLPIVPMVLVAFIASTHDKKLASNPKFDPARAPGGEFEVFWSPYQKVEYIRSDRNRPAARGIYVNGVAHQAMVEERGLRDSRRFYRQPHDYRRRQGRPPYESVLIIGAGSGNDVSAALLGGAKHIDAVEIDPVIASLGERHHPYQPYSSDKVELHVDDGRAFMTQTTKKYDLVIFALTDSLVKVSSMAQLRLENYLFTKESFRRAYELLADHGDLVVYNHYRAGWLIEKYQRTLHEATGKYPETIWKQRDFVMMAVNKTNAGAATPNLAGVATEIATDDWPFPYLQGKQIPRLYVLALVVTFALVFAMVALTHALRRRMRSGDEPTSSLPVKLAFIFMGIAFLLLETKSIVQFSLLFGTTWINTSLVFLAVLLLVLAANWAAVLVRDARALPVAYVLLLAACLVGFFFPLRNLLYLDSGAARFVLASLLTFSPIFFANFIFSITFRDQAVPEEVFGWNLLGATIGGLLEYLGMASGYNALALLVAGSYTIVFVLLAYRGISARERTPVAVAQ